MVDVLPLLVLPWILALLCGFFSFLRPSHLFLYDMISKHQERKVNLLSERSISIIAHILEMTRISLGEFWQGGMITHITPASTDGRRPETQPTPIYLDRTKQAGHSSVFRWELRIFIGAGSIYEIWRPFWCYSCKNRLLMIQQKFKIPM